MFHNYAPLSNNYSLANCSNPTANPFSLAVGFDLFYLSPQLTTITANQVW